MKKIIFTLALLISVATISFAQSEISPKADTVSTTNSSQVEFYSSEEEFIEKNPSFLQDVNDMIAITNEAYVNYIKTTKLFRRRLLA